jgi:hypothetical protein
MHASAPGQASLDEQLDALIVAGAEIDGSVATSSQSGTTKRTGTGPVTLSEVDDVSVIRASARVGW